jgi:hypothetical protein
MRQVALHWSLFIWLARRKQGLRHIKMAQIDTKTNRMKRIENNDIEKYASKSKENASKRGTQ